MQVTMPPSGLGSLRQALGTRRTRRGLVNAAPVVIYLLVLFVYPIASTLLLSLKSTDGAFTLQWYTTALSGADLDVLLTTLRISAEVSLISVVVGFILAHALTRLRPAWAAVMMMLVIVPHFISALVRTYGWIIVLGSHGVVNTVLADLHVPGAPFDLLYNETGVVIGTASMLLPYSVLLLYAMMRGVDRQLLAAAAGLGAGRLTIFRRVYLPQVASGLVNAALLTFILTLGYYLTPALMGGPKQTMIASVIDQQVMQEAHWNEAAALGIVLLLLTFAGLVIIRLVGTVSVAARNRDAS